MLARFRASSPDRCPQAAKSPCHAFGTRRGWWEKRQLFEAGRTRPPRLVSLKQLTSILQLFQWNSCNARSIVSHETMFLENQLRAVQQNRFAVCLCAVRRGLRCPNCLWIFLRLQFIRMFLVFRMANSNLLIFLRFQYSLINTFVKGDNLSPLTISLRRAEPARPQFACGMVILPVLYNLVWVYRVESALRLLPSKMFR